MRPSGARVYSWLERLRSLRHRVGFEISERIGWSRGAFHEESAGELTHLDADQTERISALGRRYGVRFEAAMAAATARENYEYLDILDRTWGSAGLARPTGGELCDVGCASFGYASALHAFFLPRRMVGVEIEGHRLFKNGHTRIDHAAGHLAALPDARFLVADYSHADLPADVITAWFPFLTPAAILAWRLPLSLLAPARLFGRIRHNLRPGGCFIMVNHGPAEAAEARRLCDAAGLRLLGELHESGVLSGYRLQPPLPSVWTHA